MENFKNKALENFKVKIIWIELDKYLEFNFTNEEKFYNTDKLFEDVLEKTIDDILPENLDDALEFIKLNLDLLTRTPDKIGKMPTPYELFTQNIREVIEDVCTQWFVNHESEIVEYLETFEN